MNNLLTIKKLSVKHANLTIEQLAIKNASLTVIIGANGAGKSTLLNELATRSPFVYLKNQSLNNFSYQNLALKRAVLSQQQQIAFDLSVETLVQLGREPYRDLFEKRFDDNVCAWAMDTMDISALRQRNSRYLSGGEQHRAHIARVLAQLIPQLGADLSGKWLLLDEPTNHLDIRHQYQLFQQIKALQQQGLTTVAILHDPILAMNLADNIVLLKNGGLFAVHTPKSLRQSDDLSQLYDINMQCGLCTETGNAYLMKVG